MQKFRPLQRLSVRAGLGHSRRTESPIRSLLRGPAAIPSVAQARTQHDDYGPHKEYFQTPGKEPKPDLTPYIRDSTVQQSPSSSLSQASSSSLAQSSSTTNPSNQTTQPKPRGWLRIPRVIRSFFWSITFFNMGAILAISLITWEYMSPPFEPGSPQEQELIEEILDALDTHPLVEDLKEQEWVEVDAFKLDLQHGIKGRSLVHQVLGGNNPQGVFMRVFHHPTAEFTMVVFFLGFGIEGWPDVVHGGMISTLLQECLGKHVAYYYPGYLTAPDSSTKIDFQQPCKPGDIYGVLVPPTNRTPVSVGNLQLTKLQLTSLMVKVEGAPVISSEVDTKLGIQKFHVEIPGRGKNPTFATCQAEIKILPKDLNHGGQAFQVGGKDDEGFGRALDVLKRRPEFKGTESTTPEDPKDSD